MQIDFYFFYSGLTVLIWFEDVGIQFWNVLRHCFFKYKTYPIPVIFSFWTPISSVLDLPIVFPTLISLSYLLSFYISVLHFRWLSQIYTLTSFHFLCLICIILQCFHFNGMLFHVQVPRNALFTSFSNISFISHKILHTLWLL